MKGVGVTLGALAALALIPSIAITSTSPCGSCPASLSLSRPNVVTSYPRKAPQPVVTTPSLQLDWVLHELIKRRGGQTKSSQKAKGKEEEDEEEEAEEEEQEEDMKEEDMEKSGEAEDDDEEGLDLDDDEAGDVKEEDFNDGALLLNLIKEVKRTPPMSKLYLGSSVAVTSAAWLLNQNHFPKFLLLDWGPVLTKLQLWRPFTTFLFLGEFGVNYFLSMHFMWTYMGHLEKMKCKDPAEFLVMILFGATALLVGSQVLGLHNHFLGHNLSCFLVYIWSRLYEGQDVNVMGLFNMPAHLLPWFFVLQTLVLEQQLPLSDLLGIAVGHLYQLLLERKLIRPPAFLSKFFKRKEIRKMYRKYEEGLNI